MAADFARAQRAAENLLKEYGVTDAPIDPELLAEANGIDVVYSSFKPDLKNKLSGFIDLQDSRIVINKDIPATRMVFTIAHELGHYVLHREWAQSEQYRVMPRKDIYPDGKPAEEQEADAFASHLLVPRNVLRRYKNVASLPELARLFCVSEPVVLNAMKRM